MPESAGLSDLLGGLWMDGVLSSVRRRSADTDGHLQADAERRDEHGCSDGVHRNETGDSAAMQHSGLCQRHHMDARSLVDLLGHGQLQLRATLENTDVGSSLIVIPVHSLVSFPVRWRHSNSYRRVYPERSTGRVHILLHSSRSDHEASLLDAILHDARLARRGVGCLL
jgi:hypothetical protein